MLSHIRVKIYLQCIFSLNNMHIYVKKVLVRDISSFIFQMENSFIALIFHLILLFKTDTAELLRSHFLCFTEFHFCFLL